MAARRVHRVVNEEKIKLQNCIPSTNTFYATFINNCMHNRNVDVGYTQTTGMWLVARLCEPECQRTWLLSHSADYIVLGVYHRHG